MILQVRVHRRLQLDDWLLLFACLTLTVGTVLVLVNIEVLFFGEAVGLNPGLIQFPADIVQRLDSYQRLYYTYPTLAWTTIFSVKLAYLYFFRRLVDRLRSLIIYWRVIVVSTVVFYLSCVISIYIACPLKGLDTGKSQVPQYMSPTDI